MTNIFRRFDDWLERMTDKAKADVRTTTPEEAAIEDFREQRQLEREAEDRRRMDENEAKARAAIPGQRAEYAKEDADATAAFQFACSLNGQFLRLDHNGESCVINTTYLQRVDYNPGQPPSDSGRVEITPHGWSESGSVLSPGRYRFLYNFPAPARDAMLDFVGAHLVLTVPHSLGQTVYNTIIDTITRKDTK